MALGVGVLIIYNTFAIVVAQRVREFALLRAIGAQGKQVRRAVMIEAFVVGLVASAIGMLVGIGLFDLLVAVVPVLKNLTGSGGVGIRIQPTTVIEVLLVGTLVTVVSAIVPAFRAARTKPIAALRVAAIDRSGTSRTRGIVGLIMIGLGAVLLLVGMAAKQGLLVGFGPVLLFLGTLVAGPVLARGFASAVGLVLDRLGMSSRLAVSNAKRNPSRTANTANALVIGMFLVVFVTAAGGAIRDWAVKEVSQFSSADLEVVSTAGAGIGHDLQAKVQSTAGVQSSVALYNGIGQARARPPSVPVGAAGAAASATGWRRATSPRWPACSRSRPARGPWPTSATTRWRCHRDRERPTSPTTARRWAARSPSPSRTG